MSEHFCRFCGAPLRHRFVDLGSSPLANSYLTVDELSRMEPFHPLCVFVCDTCFLVQLPEAAKPEHIFRDYAYFSSYSPSWLRHAERYVETMTERYGVSERSQVVEVASNDGYLLQFFATRGVPVLGIEPARNVAAAAEARGIRTVSEFFGRDLAQRLAEGGRKADLLIGNNVLAHVPDLNDFVGGLRILLAPGGVLTMEFPHLLRLMVEAQFDTIYHEHFSYFSFTTANRIFAEHGLTLFDVEALPTHGGSLRIYGRHAGETTPERSSRTRELIEREATFGIESLATYESFGERVNEVKRALLSFLIEVKREGRSVVGYGAPAKGNTLLNFCGVRTDFLDYTVDRSPHKQGRFLPGSRIPIHAPEKLRETRPDYVLILPWNLQQDIVEEHGYIADWGGRFVVPIPCVQVLS